MKKTFLFVLILTITVLSLCGCTIIGNFNKDKLSAPENLKFDETDNLLTWDKVENAESYEIKFSSSGSSDIIKSTSTERYIIENLANGEYSVSVRAVKGNAKSAYSQSITVSYVEALVLDRDSIETFYADSTLTVSWNVVANAVGYEYSYRIGDDLVRNVTTDNYFSVSDYKQMSVCIISIVAKGNSSYKDSKAVIFTYFGEADYDDVYSTITVDKANIKDVTVNFDLLSKAILDKTVDLKEYISLLDSKFVIPSDYIMELSVGEHWLYLVGTQTGRVYKLMVNDNRVPVVKVGNYLKDGEDLIGELNAYGSRFDGLFIINSTGYVAVDKTHYVITEKTLIVKADYLDEFDDGELRFALRYTNDLDSEYHYLGFSLTVSSAKAELQGYTFDYNGSDLIIPVKTNGDKIESVTCGSRTLTALEYSLDKNSLIIKSSFLKTGTYQSFSIRTLKGAILSFQVNYAIDGFVPEKEVYLFDKSSDRDLTVSGSSSSDAVILFGNGLTSSDYVYLNKQLIVTKEFLSSLDSGSYRFSAYVKDTISDFIVKVYDGNGTIRDVLLNYDLDVTTSYITFNCDCGQNEHSCVLDGMDISLESNRQAIEVDRLQSHVLNVTCDTLKKSSAYVITIPAHAIPYVQSHFSVNGVFADKFINSFDEFVFLLQYAVDGADGITVTSDAPNGQCQVEAYFSDSFIDYTKTETDYFSNASQYITSAYPCRYSLSSKGSVATLTVKYNYNPNVVVDSGMSVEALIDKSVSLAKSGRSEDFDAFAIESSAKIERITTLAELESLVKGVKPVFYGSSSIAEIVYRKALEILREYVDDDMSDLEKVATIYDYLVTHVTYDNYTLVLYNLRSEINGKTLSYTQSYIEETLKLHPALSDFLTPYLSMTDVDELYKSFSAKVSSLSSFNSYGALVNNVAVCDGIASAFKLMCLIEGIDCLEVSGLGITADGGENHAWNKVYVDGKWYIVDATWGRSSGYVNHRYFMIDERDASFTHLENTDDGARSIVQTSANGKFDYYLWKTEKYEGNDLSVDSRTELKSLLSLLKRNGALSVEIKLNYSFTSMENEIKSTYISCSYITYDDVVIVIFK